MTTLQDEVNVFDRKEPTNPVLDHLKQSSFQPDIQSYVTLDAKIYEDKSYWIELHAKYFDSEIEIFLHKNHGQLDEAIRYLENLTERSHDLLGFLKKHSLRSPLEK
jgi:hypothetical protein